MERFASTALAVHVIGDGVPSCPNHDTRVLALVVHKGVRLCPPCASAARVLALNVPALRNREFGDTSLVKAVCF